MKGKLILLCIFVALASYGVHISLRPSIIDAVPYLPIDPLPRLEGLFSANQGLQGAEILFRDQIRGPESMYFDEKGDLYTGLVDGRIVKLNLKDKTVTTFAYTGNYSKECGSFELEPECGRPLGITYHTEQGVFYVADAYKGLLQVDREGKVTTVVSSFEGKPVTFINDVAIASDGMVYFDESSRFQRRNFFYDFLEGKAHGRIYSYNPKTKKIALLLQGLYFPNGIQLSPDEEFLLISESTKSRITRFYIKGEKKGQKDIFTSNFPAISDNIRYDSHNKVYWVGTGTKRAAPFSLIDFVAPFPSLRGFLAKTIPISVYLNFMPKYGIIFALNEKGDVVKTLQDPSGAVCMISEVEYHDGYLYLGSFINPFIARVKIESTN